MNLTRSGILAPIVVTGIALMCSGTVVAAGGGAKEPAALAAATRNMFTSADRKSFDALRRSLGGDSGVAVSGVGRGQPVQFLGTLRSVIAWSTSKVPVAMAVIDAGGKSKHAGDLRQAITASDNAAAERLWSSLGSGATAARKAQAEVRAAGDSRTTVESRRLRSGFTPFGQTQWSLPDQARFTAGMTCLSSGRQVLDLMGQINSSHHWGLGVRSNARFKGGWGPGSQPGSNGGYIDRQMGTATVAGKQIAITIATRPADGSHESGTAHLTAIAKWVYSHVDTRSLPANAPCA